MDQIPLNWINSFLVFHKSKNIMEAALKLGITQPALSKQLKQLELALAEPVFTLRGRKKVLTPFGHSLYQSLQNRLGNIQEVIAQTQALHGSCQNAVVRISARRGVLDRISPRLKFSGKLFLQEAGNDSILQSLLEFSTEIGITHVLPDTHELLAKPLFRETFKLVIPKSLMPDPSPLGDELLENLKNAPCIGYKPKDVILEAAFRHYRVGVAELSVVRATENYGAIAEMVEAEVGWAILPSHLKISQKKNWVFPLPPKALPSRAFFLIYRAENKSIPWFRELITEIQSCFSE